MAKSKRNKHNGHTTVVKVNGGQSTVFSTALKWVIVGALLLSILFGVGSCNKKNSNSGKKGLIKAPSWLEKILPERPSWLPSWIPTLFYREEIIKTEVIPGDGTGDTGGNEGDGTGSTGGNEGGNPDAPQGPSAPSEPETPTVVYTVTFDPNGGTLSTEETTRTTNADGTLSTMPGAYLDGYEFLGWYTLQENGTEITLTTVFTSHTTIYAQWKEECDHIDADYNEKCDICRFEWHYIHKDADGDGACDKCDYAPCVHVDEDDDGKCDICDHEFCEHIDENDDGKCDDCKNDISEKDHECIYENEDIFCDICGNPLSFAGGSVGDGNEGADPDEPSEPETPDVPQEPDEPDTPDFTHRDADDDGKCDVCGDPYDDGDDNEGDDPDVPQEPDEPDTPSEPSEPETPEEPEECNHRDANDDGDCDVCGDPYDDGEEPDECEHRDEDDDGKCDTCGEDFRDGKDYGDFFGKTEFELVEHYDENRNVYCWYYELSKKGDFSYLVLYASDTGYIPDEIDGNPVVGLADYFYSNCLAAGAEEGSGAYVIPARIVYIGDYAFANAGYSSYVQEDSSTQICGIGDLAFVNNHNLTFIELNCAVSCKFGERIFMGCSNLPEENIWIYGYKPD